MTQKHKQKRIEFARAHRHDNLHMWGFSDEKLFRIDQTSNVVYIQNEYQIPTRKIKNNKIQQMVWGAIWYNGRSEPAFTKTNIDSKAYTNILEQHTMSKSVIFNKKT